MPLRLRGKTWWIDLVHRGRRVRRSTGTSIKAQAQRQHDELAAKLWQAKQHGRLLSEALLVWVKERPRGASDLRALRQIRADYPDRPLVDVTSASLLAVWGDKAPATYNRLVNIVRAALNMAHAREWIEAPPKLARRKAPPAAERWLTAEEWQALHSELPEHLRPVAAFSVATGLRWGNVAGLTWDRVDLERRLAWIPGAAAKARRPIAVPLSDDAVGLLASLERTGPQVFTYAGRPLGSPKTAWQAAVRRAGIRPVRWHDLRHTWASWHVMGGTPLPVLQKLGAWESPEMVQRYAHLAPSHVAQFAANARPVSQNLSQPGKGESPSP